MADHKFVKCIVCGKEVMPQDVTTGSEGSIHKDCSKQQFSRESHGKK